jgi:plastocyanin
MRKAIYSGSLLLVTITLQLILVGITGCKAEDTMPGPPPNEVYIQSSAFDPASLSVTVNTTVKWTNKEWFSHSVSSETGLFESGSISVNGTFSYKFTAPGTYQYHCSIHPAMTGTVTVN